MSETMDLLSWTPPAGDRHGETFSHALDYERLNKQQARVYDAMKDGRRRTLRQISDLTGDPEASISARLRDFNKPDLMGTHEIAMDAERMGEGRGTWHYRLVFGEDACRVHRIAGRLA